MAHSLSGRLTGQALPLRGIRFNGPNSSTHITGPSAGGVSYSSRMRRVVAMDSGALDAFHVGRGAQWYRTRRQILAEERLWRERHSRRTRGDSAQQEATPIQTAYRDLRKGREDAKDEPGAADFSYGEMEMRRFAAKWNSVERAAMPKPASAQRSATSAFI
ncbi:hypothetical protein [Streptomyces gilvosporeus]|uniref:hypothetical protein n=1 Tax=Streptomyces gilvosporeus TaxID=553510 RepID=UPI00131D34FA|nr:hypothetical protein [Streptomyces gilvosporeus]